MSSAKLFVATPSRDLMVAAAHAFSMYHSLHALRDSVSLVVPSVLYDEELIRVRSRLVQDFVESDCTHLFWLDSDVSFQPNVIEGMLATGKDFVCAPYPKKFIDWNRIEAAAIKGEKNLESRAYPYSVVLIPGADANIDPETNTVAIAGCGMGCMIMTRECVLKLVKHYSAELTFRDNPGQGREPRDTVALFQLLLVGKNLLSEDLSLCKRWRDIGGEVSLYLGPGSPVHHNGSHFYRGYLEAFQSL